MNKKYSVLTALLCVALLPLSCFSSTEPTPDTGPSGVIASTHLGSLVGEKKHGIENYTLLPKTVYSLIEEKKWHQRPVFTLVGSVLAAGGSLALMRWLTVILAKDRRARELKLKKEQHAMGAANPMLHMMRMMEMQQADEGEGQSGGTLPLPEDGQKEAPVSASELAWNQKHILKPGLRKVLSVALFLLRVASVAAVIKVLDAARDCWYGNAVPMALKHEIHLYNKGLKYLKDTDRVVKNNPNALATRSMEIKDCFGLEPFFDRADAQEQSQPQKHCLVLKKTMAARLEAAGQEAASTEQRSFASLFRIRQAAFGYDLERHHK